MGSEGPIPQRNSGSQWRTCPSVPLSQTSAQWEGTEWMFIHLLLSVIGWGPGRNDGRVSFGPHKQNYLHLEKALRQRYVDSSHREHWKWWVPAVVLICPVSTEASACPSERETPPYPWLSYLLTKVEIVWALVPIQAPLWDSAECLSIWVYLFYHD